MLIFAPPALPLQKQAALGRFCYFMRVFRFAICSSGERPGVEDPKAGSGDGGRGGAGGAGGISFWRRGILVWDQLPEAGETGSFGATGSAVIYYDKPE